MARVGRWWVITLCWIAASSLAADRPRTNPIDAALDGLDRPGIAALWRVILEHEERDARPEANLHLADLATRLPESPDPHWRIARNIYQHSKTQRDDAKDLQVAMLERAISAADRGLALDPDCAQCMLWKYASLGRIPTLKGLASGAANARTLEGLLQRGIEVSEARDDPRSRATLAHFYYARAAFQRMVPEWFWLKWVVGVRGDKSQALADARRAIDLDDTRSDFELELAANLLCLGHRDAIEAHIEEAITVLQRVRNLPASRQSEPIDSSLAVMLLDNPQAACGFSRDGFLDVDDVARSKAP